MEADERVYVLGEDLLDPYGGAFKVSKGLSTAFPDRVWTTPISEAGFTGIAAGMAMRGLLPVVEIMFGDFLMLAADQVLNHISKYRWMYNDQVEVPIVIRAPMGGRRGYGPTHSQSIEKHFLGMPGLVVLAPSPFHHPGELLAHAVLQERRPVLFIENKVMYARGLREGEHRIGDWDVQRSPGPYPTVSLSFDNFRHADLTIVTYGQMSELATEAAEELLMEEELYAEVVILSSLQPLDIDPILESLARSGRLLVCEEGTSTAGVSAEIITAVTQRGFSDLKAAPGRVGALEFPIGNARSLEEVILPQVKEILEAAQRLF